MSAQLQSTFDRWVGQAKDNGSLVIAKDFADLIGATVRLVQTPEYTGAISVLSFNRSEMTVTRADGKSAVVPFDQLDRWEYAPPVVVVVETAPAAPEPKAKAKAVKAEAKAVKHDAK